MDFSLGDPARPFRAAAAYAFARAAEDVHKYQFPNPVNPDNRRVREALEPIRAHFSARGIHPQGWSGLGYDGILMTGGGTTEGFSLICRMLAADVRAENAARARLSPALPALDPVILMPVPTYGFFQQQAPRHGLGVITVARDLAAGGALDPRAVHETILTANAAGKRVVAFYDSNPNNPLGLIRERAETEKLAQLFAWHSRAYARQEEESGRSFRWSGPASRIRLIDDMVYDGLEYKGRPRAFSFAQLPESFADTLLLAGTSKAGLAGLRAGLVIAAAEDIRRLRDRQVDDCYFPHLPAMHALSAFFNDAAPFARSRRAHLRRMAQSHEVAGRYMKALMSGFESLEGGTEEELDAMAARLARSRKIAPEAARAALASGVPGVKVITAPQAGFFHLLDFSGWTGRFYEYRGRRREVENEWSLQDLFESPNLHAASGTFMGLDFERMILRVTFAKPLADIERLAAGLEKAQARLEPLQPLPQRSKTAAAPRV
jgi:aspartate/methionine/tyrosine aminotransferase